MPTYAYRCKSCKHQFDQFQKFSEDPLTVCPECGQEIRRVIQPVGVVFKGSGWYINDSRPASKEAEAPSSDKSETQPAAGKPDAKTEPKGESKPEKKAESKEIKTAAPA